MIKEFFSRKGGQRKYRAQAMVEFAIALPVLLALLVGIMEVGRMVIMYTLVVNSSREAARYASAYGRTDSGYLRYKYCDGIKATANQTAYLAKLTSITIKYDQGPSDTTTNMSCTYSGGEDTSVTAGTGWRVTVTVTADYKPMVKLLPIKSQTFTAKSSRTILGVYSLPNP